MDRRRVGISASGLGGAADAVGGMKLMASALVDNHCEKVSKVSCSYPDVAMCFPHCSCIDAGSRWSSSARSCGLLR